MLVKKLSLVLSSALYTYRNARSSQKSSYAAFVDPAVAARVKRSVYVPGLPLCATASELRETLLRNFLYFHANSLSFAHVLFPPCPPACSSLRPPPLSSPRFPLSTHPPSFFRLGPFLPAPSSRAAASVVQWFSVCMAHIISSHCASPRASFRMLRGQFGTTKRPTFVPRRGTFSTIFHGFSMATDLLHILPGPPDTS